MGQLAADSFVRADAGTLGANWTKLSGFSDLRITSNHALASTSSPDCADAYTGVGTVSLDQYAQVKLSAANNDGGPTVRSNTTSTFYLLDMCPSTGTSDVYKCISAGFTLISHTSAITWVSGDIGYIEVQGTAIVAKQNSTIHNSFSDSAIDGSSVGGPYPGLHASATSITYGDASSIGYAMGDFAAANSLMGQMVM